MKVLFKTEPTPGVSKDTGDGRTGTGIAQFELVLNDGPADDKIAQACELPERCHASRAESRPSLVEALGVPGFGAQVLRRCSGTPSPLRYALALGVNDHVNPNAAVSDKEERTDSGTSTAETPMQSSGGGIRTSPPPRDRRSANVCFPDQAGRPTAARTSGETTDSSGSYRTSSNLASTSCVPLKRAGSNGVE